jgi:hypothetical protein
MRWQRERERERRKAAERKEGKDAHELMYEKELRSHFPIHFTFQLTLSLSE